MAERTLPEIALFDRLDAWRHFPAYQLERRADIFFSLYLREVVEEELGVQLEEAIIPEVPIKDRYSGRSCKADYLLTRRDGQCAYLIELKTDMRSRVRKQDKYLLAATQGGVAAILEGILKILQRTKAFQKYFHLVCEFGKLGLLTVPPDLENYIFPSPKTAAVVRNKFRDIRLTSLTPKLEVLYVQPLPSTTVRCIDFPTFAQHVARRGDPFSQRFSESLHRWHSRAGLREVKAGVQTGCTEAHLSSLDLTPSAGSRQL